MGDSDITLYLSAAALVIVTGAVAAFVIAWRVRKRVVRVTVGVILLAATPLCGILSFLASLLVAALGVVVLTMAAKTSQRSPTETHARPNKPPEATP